MAANKDLEIIFHKDGVHPIGPYSQCIKAGGFVFLAGQVPCDPQAKVVPGTMTDKAHRMCQNAKLILEAAGTSLEKVVKVNIYFEDIDRDFDAVNKVFGEYFVSKPARTSVQVAKLPVGCPLEMDVTALA
ncbi:Endoribonuclease L-PSP/chorismate mutase-like protein [Fusarium oxysporum f. sp. albedinis]|nr:Endoribonuclease L-PSP/chorismate mutase-like protein [Fusarium oxysporum f. sp. albedinis]KAK2469905.1 hypothetical protein H9L39_18720 [Fusarium oxysporum f. sp. albedinis]